MGSVNSWPSNSLCPRVMGRAFYADLRLFDEDLTAVVARWVNLRCRDRRPAVLRVPAAVSVLRRTLSS